MTTFKNTLASEIGISGTSPSRWNKRDYLVLRRVATQMFLDGDVPTLNEAANYLFAQFDSTPVFTNPFVTCMQPKHLYYKSSVNLRHVLECSKDEFLNVVHKRLRKNEPVDALLYLQLVQPDVRLDLFSYELLTHKIVAEVKDFASKVAVIPPAVKQTEPVPQPESKPNDTTREPLPVAAPMLPANSLSQATNAALDNLLGNSADIQELSIALMYVSDNLEKLFEEQRKTQDMLRQLLRQRDVPQERKSEETTEVVKNRKRISLLVVGMWPRQYESLRLGFKKEFFDYFEVNYVPSDKLRKGQLEGASGYDHVVINTSAINHSIEQLVRANIHEFTRYAGGVSALRTLMVSKANRGDFGDEVRKQFINWLI